MNSHKAMLPTLSLLLFFQGVSNCNQEGEVEEGDFKKALEKIAIIMNRSIDVGTNLNLS